MRARTACTQLIIKGLKIGWIDFEERFEQFGDYEDAISRHHRVMWHGVLTPMLNIGLLTPSRSFVVLWRPGESRSIPLNSLEGFVRQIIGWREFMAAVYQRHGRQMRTTNFWGFDNQPLPEALHGNDRTASD